MKLVRFGPSGAEQPGIWLESAEGHSQPMILDVQAMAFDIEDYNAHFFSHHGLERLSNLLKEKKRKLIPAKGQRLGAALPRPAQIIALGKNYAAHAKEFGSPVPDSPIIFAKATTALNGPYDPVILPRGAKLVDSEVELAIVIGRATHRISSADALQAIAGYTVLNDITDRTIQRGDGQWFRSKSAVTFCPVGPYLVTTDEVPDCNRLRLVSKINNTILQDDNTANMIFKIPFLIEFISARIALEPGDIIATGTPAGIGSARQPALLLKPGDTIEISVEGMGRQINRVIAEN